jgi:hypothetical protein
MRRGCGLVLVALLALAPRPAQADPPAAPQPAQESPKRPVPDYDGRGPPPAPPGDAPLWVPRVLLSPVYLVTEYGVRRPLSIAVPAAEHADLPRKVYDFFTFGPEHKVGVAPIGLVEFNFNPSVGVYAFWDDAGFEGDHLRLHAEAWPTDWVAGSLTQRIVLDRARSLQIRLSGIRRPDRVFYGLGPSSLESSQSRYGEQRFDAGATYDWRFWRSSRIQTSVGVRDVRTYDGSYGSDPSLTKEAATGAFQVPDGFGQEYTAQYNRVVAALDTRVPADRLGSGVRLELAGEQGNELRQSPASGWMKYGGTAAGFVDLNGHARVLGLSVTALFGDPLGSRPIPFPELPYLGGDHPMLAYYAERMVGRSAAAATASYDWPIGPWLDGHLEMAAGNAFGTHLESFDPRLLRLSGAFGVSIAGLQDAPVEFLLGVGTETFSDGTKIDSLRVMLGVPHTF